MFGVKEKSIPMDLGGVKDKDYDLLLNHKTGYD
jgi:hypothetical protein